MSLIVLFLIMDVVLSFLLPIFIIYALISVLLIFVLTHNLWSVMSQIISKYFSFEALSDYIFRDGGYITLADVLTPSTLFPSLWTILIMLSSLLTVLLVPIDQIRRFTAWWFRDVEKRPLTVIAKVAGTLIIIGAVVTKAIRWFGT